MADVSSYDPALKQIYKQELLEVLTYKSRPLLGLLPKFEKFGGRNMPVPLFVTNPQGVSAVFTTAQSNVTDAAAQDFLVTRVQKYSLAHISSEVAAATMDNKHAFLSAIKKEVDMAMNSLSDTLESDLFQDGTGYLGSIGGLSTTSLTLSDINDVTNFEVNMQIVASEGTSGAHGDSLINSGANALCTGVNRTTGVLTAASDWDSQISGLAVDDFLYRDGDAADGGDNVCVEGLESWLNSTASLFGVTRTTDTRYQGVTHDGSTQPVEEAFIDGQSKCAREGGRPDILVCNNVQYRKLAKELGSKKEYSETNAAGGKGMVAGVSYRGIKVHGDYGEMQVVAANKCPSTAAYALQKDTWLLASLGPCVRFDDIDGNRLLRRASNAGVEARLVSWGNLACKAPVYNARITLASAT